MHAVGTAGGILVGVNSDVFEVISSDIKSFSVSTVVRIKKSFGIVVRLTIAYGSPYEGKDTFILELHELFLSWDGPAMIGGDFNLVRSQSDKSNGVIDFK
jgi:hypothetical protein